MPSHCLPVKILKKGVGLVQNNIKVDYSLYLVTERSFLGNLSLEAAVEQAITGGVTLVQLREKNLSTLEFYNTALKIKKVTDAYGIPLIINDRADIALAVDAAGLHVGQDDLPAKTARKILGKTKLIGVSVATVAEALKAVEEGADYIGVGAVFPTMTKRDTNHIGVARLAEIKKAVDIPVVAIGGINMDNVALLKGAQIDGIATVSAILGSANIKKAAMELKQQIGFKIEERSL